MRLPNGLGTPRKHATTRSARHRLNSDRTCRSHPLACFDRSLRAIFTEVASQTEGPMIPIAKPWFGQQEERALLTPLRSGWVMQGPEVAGFEAAFANFVGAQFARRCRSLFRRYSRRASKRKSFGCQSHTQSQSASWDPDKGPSRAWRAPAFPPFRTASALTALWASADATLGTRNHFGTGTGEDT